MKVFLRNRQIHLLLIVFSSIQVLLFAFKGLPLVFDIVRFHLNYVASFAAVQSLADPLPRWLPNLNAGYGSPSFVFYGPLPYFVASLFYKITASLRISMVLAGWIGVAIGTLSMYGILNRFYSQGLALAGALLFATRLHTVALLSALGTIWATNLIPFVFYGLFLWLESLESKGQNKSKPLAAFLILTVALGLFFMTHAISILLFGVLMFLIGTIFFLLSRSLRTLFTIAPLVSGVVLGALYLVPLIFYKKYVQSEYAVIDVQIAKTILDSPLDLPFLDLLLFAAGIVLPAWNLYAARAEAKNASPEPSLSGKLWTSIMISTIVWTLISFVMQFRISLPIWLSHNLIQSLQYPERLITMLEILVYLALIPAISRFSASSSRVAAMLDFIARRRVVFCLLLALTTLSVYHFNHVLRQTKGYLSKDESDPINYPIDGSPIRSLADGGHYRPIGIPIRTNYFDFETTSTPIEFTGSIGRVKLAQAGPGKVSVHQFYLPGWTAWTAEGQTLDVQPDDRGLISVNVDAGTSTVYFKPMAQGIVPLANWITVIGFGLWSVAGLFLLIRTRYS